MAAIRFRACPRVCAVFLIFLGSLMLACVLTPAAPAVAGPALFKDAPCWFAIPRDRDIRCGHLLVPENRDKPDTPTIELAVVIFEPDRVRHEPVVYLNGGPGQPAGIETRDDIDEWWSYIDNGAWLRGRRLVVFDQRGVGLSKP